MSEIENKPESKTQKNLTQEEIFLSLNQTIKSATSVIKWLIWPATVVFLFGAGLLGWTSYVKIGRLDKLEEEIQTKKNEVTDLVYKVQEKRMEINDDQESLKKEQQVLEEEIGAQMNEIVKLKQRSSSVTAQGNSLISNIEKTRVHAQDLLDKTDYRLNEQNSYLEINKNKIELAIKGINDKEAMLEQLKKEREIEIEKIKNVNSLFIEYLFYVAKGRNSFPDPYMEQEIEILNRIAFILYPSEKERTAFVQKIMKIGQ